VVMAVCTARRSITVPVDTFPLFFFSGLHTKSFKKKQQHPIPPTQNSAQATLKTAERLLRGVVVPTGLPLSACHCGGTSIRAGAALKTQSTAPTSSLPPPIDVHHHVALEVFTSLRSKREREQTRGVRSDA